MLGGPGSRFPLRVSANGRHFVSADGRPFPIVGCAGWCAATALSAANQLVYLDDLKTRRFTAVLCEFPEILFSTGSANDFDGDSPWTGTAFQSSLNSTYWAKRQTFTRAALAREIVVFLNPAYVGIGGEGFSAAMTSASNAQMESYGQSFGALFKDEPNVVIHLSGDVLVSSTIRDRVEALRTGIASAAPKFQLYSEHYSRTNSAHDQPEPWHTWDFVYSSPPGSPFSHVETLAGWNSSPTMPALLTEGCYEADGTDDTPLDMRRQIWGSFLFGSCGHIYGHNLIWQFASGWETALAADGRVAMRYFRDFLDSVAWWLRVPDATDSAGDGGAFISSNRGTLASTSHIPACIASDASWAAAYFPTGSTAGSKTVQHSVIGGRFNIDWLNVRSGAYTPVASNQANTGTTSVTAPDTNDWLLVARRI